MSSLETRHETTLTAIACLTRSEVKEAVSARQQLCHTRSEDAVSPLTVAMPSGKLKGYVTRPEAEAAGKSRSPLIGHTPPSTTLRQPAPPQLSAARVTEELLAFAQ